MHSADGCKGREEEEVQECIQQMVVKAERRRYRSVFSRWLQKKREGGGTGVHSADGCESREEEVQECIQQMVAKEERKRSSSKRRKKRQCERKQQKRAIELAKKSAKKSAKKQGSKVQCNPVTNNRE